MTPRDHCFFPRIFIPGIALAATLLTAAAGAPGEQPPAAPVATVQAGPPALTPTPARAQAPPAAPPPSAAQRRESGTLLLDGVPTPDPALAALLARYQQSRGATFLDWLADGSILVSTRFGETEQVHRVAAALGMRLYKVGLTWPLEPAGARRFADGLQEILVV